MQELSQIPKQQQMEDYHGEKLAILRIRGFAASALFNCDEWLKVCTDWVALVGSQDTLREGLTVSQRKRAQGLEEDMKQYELVAIANGKQAEDLMKS